MIHFQQATEYDHIKTNTEIEWKDCLSRWSFWRNVHKCLYVALLLLTILAGTVAGVFTLLVDIEQVLWLGPLVWAGIAGTIGGSLRLVEAAVSPGEKGRFYDILVTECDILLSDLINEARTYDDVVLLRDRFETIRRSAQEGVPRGKGMKHISGMAKELGQKNLVSSKYSLSKDPATAI